MTLLAQSCLRSHDLEADSPDSTRPLTEPPINQCTGMFADSEHTTAFQSKVFRLMLPMHVIVLVCYICAGVSFVLALNREHVTIETLATSLWLTAICVLGLAARMAVHRWEDQSKAQRHGTFAWTMTVASGCMIQSIIALLRPGLKDRTSQGPGCGASAMYASSLFGALFAFINATQGMEFWHTASLTSLVICKQSFVATVP